MSTTDTEIQNMYIDFLYDMIHDIIKDISFWSLSFRTFQDPSFPLLSFGMELEMVQVGKKVPPPDQKRKARSHGPSSHEDGIKL